MTADPHPFRAEPKGNPYCMHQTPGAWFRFCNLPANAPVHTLPQLQEETETDG